MPIGLPLGDIMDITSLNYFKNYQDFDYSKYSRNGDNFRLSHFAAGGAKKKKATKAAKTAKVPQAPKTKAKTTKAKVTQKAPPAKPRVPKKTPGRKRTGGAEASPTYLTVPIKSIYNTSSLDFNNNWEYVPIKKLSSVPYSHFQS